MKNNCIWVNIKYELGGVEFFYVLKGGWNFFKLLTKKFHTPTVLNGHILHFIN